MTQRGRPERSQGVESAGGTWTAALRARLGARHQRQLQHASCRAGRSAWRLPPAGTTSAPCARLTSSPWTATARRWAAADGRRPKRCCTSPSPAHEVPAPSCTRIRFAAPCSPTCTAMPAGFTSTATKCSRASTAWRRTSISEWVPILENDQDMPRLAEVLAKNARRPSSGARRAPPPARALHLGRDARRSGAARGNPRVPVRDARPAIALR